LQQCIKFNLKKVAVTFLQGSVVTLQTMLGGLTISSGYKFNIVYMCHKLWKLAGSRQSYCRNMQAYFFGPPCILLVSESYTLQRYLSVVTNCVH